MAPLSPKNDITTKCGRCHAACGHSSEPPSSLAGANGKLVYSCNAHIVCTFVSVPAIKAGHQYVCGHTNARGIEPEGQNVSAHKGRPPMHYVACKLRVVGVMVRGNRSGVLLIVGVDVRAPEKAECISQLELQHS